MDKTFPIYLHNSFVQQALITIQKTVKMYLAKKKNKPRYLMLMKIRNLSSQLKQIVSLAKNLKSEKDSVEKAAKKIQENISEVVAKIKFNDKIRGKDMEKYYQMLVDQINKELANVKTKVNNILTAVHFTNKTTAD